MVVSRQLIDLGEDAIPGLNDVNDTSVALQTALPSAPSPGVAGQRDDITIELYAGAPPAAVDTAMQALYGNIHSTFAHLTVYGGLQEVGYSYVARSKDRLLAIFLLRRDGRTVHVVNEGMTVDDVELERFAGHIFSIWRSVSAICLHAVDSQVRILPRPFQQYACTANIVLPLPATADAYVASLGKNMRRNLRRYMDKLKRDHPSLQIDVTEKDDASEEDMRAIIELNRMRIADKNIRYGLDDEVEKVIALERSCGMLVAMRVDGQVIAGSIGYFAGSNYFFKVISHDPRYNEYSAGILCCYLTICECIARGCKEYNFMWNEYEYKFALGAHSRSLHHVVVYRSRLHLLRRPRLALSNALAAGQHWVNSLFDRAGKDEDLSRVERAVVRILGGLRSAKRALTGLRSRA
jgi:hypothetical protein